MIDLGDDPHDLKGMGSYRGNTIRVKEHFLEATIHKRPRAQEVVLVWNKEELVGVNVLQFGDEEYNE